MRVAGQDECVRADPPIFVDPLGQCVGVADQRRSGAAPRTSPTPAQRLGLTSSLSRRPPCRAFMRCCPTKSMREKTFCAPAIVSSSSFSISLSRGGPSGRACLAYDHMQSDPERHLPARLFRAPAYVVELGRHILRRLSPTQIFVDRS